MKILEIIIVDCKKAELICTKKQYNEASYIDFLRLKTHLFFCKNCQQKSRRNNRLTSLIKSMKIEPCPDDFKSDLRQSIARASKVNIERTT